MPDVSLSSVLSKPLPQRLLIFVLVVVSVMVFQGLTGVWSSDIGADPDEPAHAVTSLMVRDYFTDGLGSSPLTFAQHYYDAFPKVALGHYPPGYYALMAMFLLAWPHSETFFVLQALLCGFLAVQVFGLGRRLGMSVVAAAVAATLTISLPVTLKLTQLVMADLLLANFCLLAVSFWGRFGEKPRISMALGFGFAAAAAILTKGSGMALALVPAVSILAMGRWDWLKKISFWLAGAPVAVIAWPWMLYSSNITKEGMVTTPLGQYIADGLSFYTITLGSSLTLPVVALALVGGLMWLKRQDQPMAERSALLGLMVGTVLIMLLVPTGYSTRYFMPLLPVVTLLAVLGVCHLVTRPRWQVSGLIALVVVVWAHYPSFAIQMKNVAGYHDAVQLALQERPENDKEHWLVSGDPRGEGAVIAEAALALPKRSPSPLQIHRASKDLAATDWLGRDYKVTYTTPAEIQSYLDQNKITCVFVDQLPTSEKRWAHEEILLQALQTNPGWKLLHEGPATRPYQKQANSLKVFRRLP